MGITDFKKVVARLMLICMLAGMLMMSGMNKTIWAEEGSENEDNLSVIEEINGEGSQEESQVLMFGMMGEESVVWEGNGSQEAPYEVSSAAHLNDVRNKMGYNVHFVQTQDIDLSDYSNWVPIGDSENKFIGSYDGAGYAIRNLTIDNSSLEYVGLFGYVGYGGDTTELKNIKLENTDITSSVHSRTGSLAGYARNTTISGCSNSGSVINTIKGYNGGLVGLLDIYGTIRNCSSSGIVTGGNNGNVGGLVGINYGTIDSCTTDCSVSVGDLGLAGGLVGANDSYDGSGGINNCRSSGNVSGGEWAYVGGIAAHHTGNGINNCYSTANVSVGNDGRIGGLVANWIDGTITSCYFDTAAAGTGSSAGGTPMDTGAMKLKSTYTGWDFINIWKLVDNAGYPTLRWEPWTADEEIAEAIRILTWDTIKGNNEDADEVTEQLELSEVGARGTSISWSVVTGEEWINISTGDIIRPVYEEGDKPIILRATINKSGGTTLSKEISLKVKANEQGWVGEGDGSQDNPYLVSNTDQLDDVRNRMGPGVYFRQTSNINLPENVNWVPIGDSTTPFQGYYNGCGYTISGLKIQNGTLANIGLFGYSRGTIENVILENVNINGWYVNSDPLVSTCIGALVGRSNGIVSNCSSSGNVTGNNALVGGLVGFNDSGVIRKSFNSSSVSAGANSSIGGVTGTNAGSIENTYNTGTVSGSSGMIGGLVGYNATGANIYYCYSSGSVTGSGSGGLVGFNYNFQFGAPGIIHLSYYNRETSGADNGLGLSRNTSEMNLKTTFTNWNFDDTWRIADGYLHPVLKWQPQLPDEDTAFAASALTWDTIKGGNTAPDNIITNLILPSAGSFSTNISWSADYGGEWINVATGVVNRPALEDGNKQVALTATVTKSGGTSRTKQFVLTVKKLQHTVTYTAGPNGSITGTAIQIVNHGGNSSTVTAVPNPGYHFVRWSDGITTPDRHDINIEDNFGVTAQFAQNTVLTITAHTKSKTYGEPDPALTYEITSGTLAQGDTVSGTLERAAGNDAGTYEILKGSLTAGPKYNINFVSAGFTINPKPLTITADNKFKIYNGMGYNDFTAVYEGFVQGEDETFLSGALSFGGAAATAVEGGTYEIIPEGLNSDNYNITYVPGILEIGRKSLTVTADNKTKVYDGEVYDGFTVTYNGFIEGEDETDLSGTITYNLAATTAVDVGTYPVIPGGLTSESYDITFIGGSLEITKRALTVTADDKSKIYGDADPEFTYRVTSGSLAGTDSFSGALNRVIGESLGIYAIQQGTLTAGNNYEISYIPAVLSVTEKALTVTATVQNKIYDGNTVAIITGSELTGVVHGDDVVLGNHETGAFAQSNTGTGIEIITNMSISGADAGNYTLIQPVLNADITPKPLTIRANPVNKTYGEADPLLTYGIISGE